MEKRAELPKLPYSVGDRGSYIRKAAVALEVYQVPTVKVVTFNIPYARVETIDIPVSRISFDPQTRDQYYVDGDHVSGGPLSMAKTHLSWLRSRALESGATPDAIRLLSKATGAFTKKEEKEMAEKLTSRSKPKAANKAGLKAAANAAPVGGKKRGNAEALAKAREARASTPDTRKIVALKKAKDIEARDGTFRKQMLTDLLASKTVADFRAKDTKYDAGCLRFAQEAGYIKELPARA